ncbi:MAG TPA: mechanosensitive ion channel domain-containing protein [Terracidiphilus sp.]|nr:mechanosensitive ion channel domain-containing protein [Terracidiphilus sp.]
MANSPALPAHNGPSGAHTLGKVRVTLLLVLLALLAMCIFFSWTTRGAMSTLPSLNRRGVAGKATAAQTLVDLRPWQTAEALAPMAVTAEEKEYASEAESLADHEVDQAFAAALRTASLAAQHRTLTGEALALSQKVAQLQQLKQQDQALVDSLQVKASKAGGSADKDAVPDSTGGDLEVAKAQLGLDTDELADAQRDLARASGDNSGRIQDELAAHEAAMRQYDSEVKSGGQIAVLSVAQNGTLARRIKAWFSQQERSGLIEQALQEAQDDANRLTAEHNALESTANAAATAAAGAASDRATRLANLSDRSVERQILSIDDDRIQTEQQLVSVYSKWQTQVALQHRIVLHLIVQSLMLILFILIGMVVCDTLVRRLMAHPALDRRQMRTLRSVLEMSIQVVGVLLILLVVFGSPQQTPTILGLTTAALTIALQDYIVAFLGWFVLMGKNGIHVGDWVEINRVGGEVTEIGLMATTLLETGGVAGEGHPTGRRISFMNSFAIRGQYFNFSTAGQWMWDEIAISLPSSTDIHTAIEKIHQAVSEETEESWRTAEREWKHATREEGLGRFSAAPVVNLRPTGTGTDLQIRYVTAASERFAVRNRLYQRVVELLHAPQDTPIVGKNSI